MPFALVAEPVRVPVGSQLCLIEADSLGKGYPHGVKPPWSWRCMEFSSWLTSVSPLFCANAWGYKRVDRAIAVIWKMLMVAEQRFRRLKAPELIEDVYLGAQYVDGIVSETTAEKVAA